MLQKSASWLSFGKVCVCIHVTMLGWSGCIKNSGQKDTQAWGAGPGTSKVKKKALKLFLYLSKVKWDFISTSHLFFSASVARPPQPTTTSLFKFRAQRSLKPNSKISGVENLMGLMQILDDAGAVRWDGFCPTSQGLLEMKAWEGGKGPLHGGGKKERPVLVQELWQLLVHLEIILHELGF